MTAGFLHHLKRPGLEHLSGLNVDVAVSDYHGPSMFPSPDERANCIEQQITGTWFLVLGFQIQAQRAQMKTTTKYQQLSTAARRHHSPLRKHAHNLPAIFRRHGGGSE